MLTLNCDGLPQWNGGDRLTSGRPKKTITIPADLAMSDSAIIDSVIEAVFDLLGQCALELRVRAESHSANAQRNVRAALKTRTAA